MFNLGLLDYALLLLLIVAVVFIVYSERSHVKAMLTAAGVLDSQGNFRALTAGEAVLHSIEGDFTGPAGPAGPQGEPGKDAALPAGCVVIAPDAPNYAAIMALAPAGSAGVTVTG